jgi:hypothetical protein
VRRPSGGGAMTPSEFRERGYLDELARLSDQAPVVRALLERVGVPVGNVPPGWGCGGGVPPRRLDGLLQAARQMPPTQPRPGRPRQVPAPAADFVGRQDDLKALLAGFRDGDGSAVAVISGVSGQRGVGKTELALKLATLVGGPHPEDRASRLRRAGEAAGSAAAAPPYVALLARRPSVRRRRLGTRGTARRRRLRRGLAGAAPVVSQPALRPEVLPGPGGA